MKKYIFAGMLAACVLFSAAAQNQKRPEPVTITGTVKASDSFATIVTADGKEYALMTMDGDMGNPPAGDRKGPPPQGKAPEGQPPEGQPPKMVTRDEVKALNGKKVSVTGFVPVADDEMRKNAPKDMPEPPKDAPKPPKDGVLMITSYEVK